MIVETQTGSTYVIDHDLMTVTRVRSTHDLRRDGDALRLFERVDPRLGLSMTMLLEPLASGADVTVRVTSPVTCVIGRE